MRLRLLQHLSFYQWPLLELPLLELLLREQLLLLEAPLPLVLRLWVVLWPQELRLWVAWLRLSVVLWQQEQRQQVEPSRVLLLEGPLFQEPQLLEESLARQLVL